jgi:hypothetical protein
MPLQTITKVGCFDQDIANQINSNFQVAGSTAGNTHITGTLTVDGASTLTGNVSAGGTLGVTGATTLTGLLTANGGIAPAVQVCSGSADAVTFASAVNIAIFTSTGPDAATLATPGAGDVGKVLVLVNTNTTQNVVTTAANKIGNGTASTGDTLTAPAHAGAVTILVASNGLWNMGVLGTGSWVLTEV